MTKGNEPTSLLELAERCERLSAERDFLLARANKAGACSFGDNKRWTGMSSNALVTIAFGGEDASLPSDENDLSACYLTVMRLPPHLLSEAIFKRIEDGEAVVRSHMESDLSWARANAEWPGIASLRARHHASKDPSHAD